MADQLFRLIAALDNHFAADDQLPADVTDSLAAYRGLSPEYIHETVDHAIEHVRGTVHVNGLENFWSLLKRTFKGTYVAVSPMHLDRYIDEQTLRFNVRKDNDAGRFQHVMRSAPGRRITYARLTGSRKPS